MTRKQGAVRQGFAADERNQETEIEFLEAPPTLPSKAEDPDHKRLNRFSSGPDVANRMSWNIWLRAFLLGLSRWIGFFASRTARCRRRAREFARLNRQPLR
jgi:hypothetical protein